MAKFLRAEVGQSITESLAVEIHQLLRQDKTWNFREAAINLTDLIRTERHKNEKEESLGQKGCYSIANYIF